MSWATPKRIYPLGAVLTVSVKATDFQKNRWKDAAEKHGKGSAGAFLAWAGDVMIDMLYTWERTNEEFEREIKSEGCGL